MSETAVRGLVERLVSAWDARDMEAFLGCLDPEVVWSDPAMLYGPAVGGEAVRAFCSNLLNAFPDFAFRIREPICTSDSGDRCAIPWEIEATHTGRFEPVGFAPTNRRVRMQGVDLVDIAGGRIRRIETHFDVLPAAQQALGLGPFPRRGLLKALAVAGQRSRAWWLRRKGPKDAGAPAG